MDISDVVDKESQGVGFCLFFVVLQELHHGDIHEVVLVVVLLKEPVSDEWNHSGDVLFIDLEIGEGGELVILVKEWLISIVPCGLEAATLVLDLISHGSTFNEGVVTLDTNGEVIVFHHCKPVVSEAECFWALLLQDVISHSCN